MKTNILKIRHLLIVFIILFVNNKISSQDTIKQFFETLNLKMQLLDTKLQLTETKLKLLESTPYQLNQKFNRIDSIFLLHIDSIYKHVYIMTGKQKVESFTQKTPTDSVKSIKPCKTVIKISPTRIFEGTLQLSYERTIKENFSVDFTAFVTYVTKNSVGGRYFKKQDLEYYSALTNSYEYYSGEMMTGCGAVVQTRNYLLQRINSKYKAPFGLLCFAISDVSKNYNFRDIHKHI